MTMPSPVVLGPYSLVEAERYLRDTVVPLRLACTTSTGWPLVLSLWYLYRDGALWCATSPRALILRHLEHDGRCGFEVAPNEPPYRGVRGQAQAALIRGAGGGLLYFLFIAAANGARVWSASTAIANLIILTLLGGGSAAATLVLARKASRALTPGEEPPSLGKGGIENHHG